MSTTEYPIQRLLIGASASIGVVNLIPYIVEFKKSKFSKSVQVIITDNASNLVHPAALRMFCDEVHTEILDSSGKVKHIELAKWAELFLVMPASADIIGKAAHGIATDLLSTTIIASECSTIFVPNMNQAMYLKPAVQRNIQQLLDDGYDVIKPEMQIGYQVSTGQIVESPMMPSATMVMNLSYEILQKKRKSQEVT